MAAIQKFNSFMNSAMSGKQVLNNGVANLNGFSNYKYKVALSNTLPSATNTIFSSITEIAISGGYPAGGYSTTPTLTLTGGVTTLFFTDVSFTAVGGAIGPFQYAVLYVFQNDANTLTGADQWLVGWIDSGAPAIVANSQGYLIDFDGTNGVFQYTS